jgi:subtilisin family serine protease
MAGRLRGASVLLVLGLTASMTGAPATQLVAAQAAQARPATATAAQQWTVTLVTGDRVRVSRSASGVYSAAVVGPSQSGHFHVSNQDAHLYVVPTSVRRLVPKVLDLALFDVRGLVEQGYDDAHTAALPVVVTQAGAESGRRLEASTAGAVDARRVLPKVGMVTARLPKEKAAELGSQLSARAEPGRKATATGTGLAGVQRMWLDRRVRALWDRNLDQVGAPAAWAAGLDGTGVTVAVLDTGIDDTHPDLVGKVTVSKDFTESGSVKDGHGHGTHVASLVAGTGAGNPNLRKGVAPGASLIVGKVLDDGGSGSFEGVLAGMEWAVAQGADIVSMSLGGGPSDGTDPLSLAVNELTDQGALFVIAAGNSGPDPMSVSSPAAADDSLAVGAVDGDDVLADFSSVGPRRRNRALKPDVTAPGVDIIAARATGTEMGDVVNDRYTSASGTSMATPMVAGAAAVLLQRHPTWTPDQLKAALAGTADPHPGFGPYEQGSGRIDVAEALGSAVVPLDEDADLGLLRYPQTDVATATAGWRNDGSVTVTLDLTLAVRGPDGAPVPPTSVQLSASTVTIEPGGTAQVTITADPRVTTPGDHSGYLVAAVRGTADTLQTPVGFNDEVESYDLELRGINRAGGPAAYDFVTVINVDDMWALPPSFEMFGEDGTLTMRLPVGRYAAYAEILDWRGDEESPEFDALSLAIDPEFAVLADTQRVLDARPSHVLSSTMTGVTTSPGSLFVSYTRSDGADNTAGFGVLLTPADVPVFVPELPPVTVGAVSTMVNWRLRQPVVELGTASGPVAVTPAAFAPLPASGPLTAVDVGAGSQADFDAHDVTGRLAVVRRGQPLPVLAARARLAGAKLLAVVNDQPGGFWGFTFPEAELPTLLVAGDSAPGLLAAAAGNEPVQVTTRPYSAYVFDLHEPGQGGFRQPFAKTYSAVERSQLARVDARYPRVPAEHVLQGRGFISDGLSAFSIEPVGKTRRTEYVTPGVLVDELVFWRYPLTMVGFTGEILLFGKPRALKAGQRTTSTWLAPPLRPAIVAPVERFENALLVSMTELSDGDGHVGFSLQFNDESESRKFLTLYRNGVRVARVADLSAVFPLSTGNARYRLVADADSRGQTPLRTRTQASWLFTSKRPPRSAPSVILPLPVVDYDLRIDDRSRLASRLLIVNVGPQPGAGRVRIDAFTFRFSTDGGKTWRPAQAVNRLQNGRYRLRLPQLPSGKVVSFRVDTTTSAGVRHVETVFRAVQVG